MIPIHHNLNHPFKASNLCERQRKFWTFLLPPKEVLYSAPGSPQSTLSLPVVDIV